MLYLSPFITAYILFMVALLGLCLGSFINCAAYRTARGARFSSGRSRCPHCGHTLGAFELIPLVSYIIQRGKCRHCKTAISLRYPAVELLCALALVSLALRYDLSLDFLQLGGLLCILLAMALIDFETYTLPDGLQITAILWFVFTTIFKEGRLFTNLLDGILNALYIALPIFVLVLIMDKLMKKETMGGGDIKLFFTAGLYFSWQVNLFTVILACICGIFFALIKKNEKKQFPFGPAICTAFFLSMHIAQPIVNWYLSLFNI